MATASTNGASKIAGDVLRFADITLDEVRHEVFRGETRVDLTATEFALLRFFLMNPRRVLSKGQILQNVWKYDFGGNSNVVETYVSYLRKKLDAFGPPLIRTVRQVGYMLEAEE
jgi:two-component system OmpR family response regulator